MTLRLIALLLAVLSALVLLVTVIVGYEPPLPPGWYLQGPAA